MPQVFLFSLCKDYNDTFDSVRDYYNDIFMDDRINVVDQYPLPISGKTVSFSKLCTEKWSKHLLNYSGINNFF